MSSNNAQGSIILLCRGAVASVVVPLHCLLDLLHFFDSRLPRLLGLFGRLVEPRRVGPAVASTDTVPDCEELPVVVAIKYSLA